MHYFYSHKNLGYPKHLTLSKHLHILFYLQPFVRISSYIIINILPYGHSIFPVRTWPSSI